MHLGPLRLALVVAVARTAAGQSTNEIEACHNVKQSNGTVSPKCGKRWAIMNKVTVPEYWEVHELELFWDSTCQLQIPGVPISSEVMTSLLENDARKAFDEDLGTRWSANCRALLGGCKPMTTYVGINRGSAPAINVDPNVAFATVRCLRLVQSPNVTRQSPNITVVVWTDETEASFVEVNSYSELSGGSWQMRPAREQGLWRLWNLSPTERPWQIAELVFYSDLFCTRRATGVPISSGAFLPDGCIDAGACDPYLPERAFDGVTKPGYFLPEPLPTRWIANCPFYEGCKMHGSWIGLDFGDRPVSIQCIRIYQPTHEGYPFWGYSHFSSSVLLQSWNGWDKWKDEFFFNDLAHGAWNDTRPSAGTAWRLANFDRIPGAWEVYEVRFYTEPNCGAGGSAGELTGDYIDSNPTLTFSAQEQECRLLMGSCAELAFDRNEGTAWRSACDPCGQHEAWVGQLFSKARTVSCFRIFQGENVLHHTAAVQLSVWDGDDWVNRRFESGLGGGTWNYRPAQPLSGWRLLATSVTTLPWTVVGLAFYSDVICNTQLQAYEISCGNDLLHPPVDAFDDTNKTEWVASCTPAYAGAEGCASSSAWLGLHSASGAMDVKCIRLQQHRLRARQADTAVLQYWDGMMWVRPTATQAFSELGGGAWQVLPGARGSMWRFIAHPVTGGFGVGVAEFSVYRTATCHSKVDAGYPNVNPISSGFASAREIVDSTKYTAHLAAIGDFGMAGPDWAFDDDLSTFWADLGPAPAWVGLDLTTQAADVMCVKLTLAGVRTLQAATAEVQGWDGEVWATLASSATHAALRLAFPLPGGGGWQRRPAPALTMWRLENDVTVTAWEVMEIQLFADGQCKTQPLHGWAIASARSAALGVPAGGHFLPARAFDGNLATIWAADCNSDGGCSPGSAWIGLNFDSPASVKCLRIFQSGLRERQLSTVMLSAWQGHSWEPTIRYSGLGGDTWNMRPVGPDTLWRMMFVERQADVCIGFSELSYERAWGVSELELYSDDDCSVRLPGPADGAEVIASGTRTSNVAVRDVRSSSFSPENAFDGNINSFWSAECASAGLDAQCREGSDWIGLDFNRANGGMPVDVKCFRIHQSRSLGSECCDPASKLQLERWNGTQWVPAKWKPLERAVSPVEGYFSKLGKCPALAANLQGGASAQPWEQRQRRQTEQCAVPLSAAVRLLADPLCEKHPGCVNAGFSGSCCPSDAGSAVSQCCCDFLMSDEVFEDEVEVGTLNEPRQEAPIVGLELVVIRAMIVLPWMGIFASLVFYVLVRCPEPEEGASGHKLWIMVCKPVNTWIDSGTMPARVTAFLCRPVVGESNGVLLSKRLCALTLGFLIGGFFVWIMFSYIIAELLLRVMLVLSKIIRFAKSPYNPKDPADKKRLMMVLAVPVRAEGTGLKVPSVGAIAAQTVAAVFSAVTTFVRCILDVILIRLAFMSIGSVDLTVSVPDILSYTPELPQIIDADGFMKFLFDLVNLASKAFMTLIRTMFDGVPRCEGPVLVFSGMCLVAISLILIRWLNYDYFGLLTATKHCLRNTRPMFTKTLCVGITASIEAGIFIFMQCIMLILGRAIDLLQFDSEQWQCPYEGEVLAIIVGRVFLVLMATIALIMTFLSANGHFLGQDYITSEFAKHIDMDLTALDPDGAGSDGDVFRWSSAFSMFPATFGIWIDNWNVKGFLIKERATVYAAEMNFPEICPHCGEAHVPYFEIMKATGMQLSLAWQLFPFAGAVVGKACEYLNNPPLFYYGTSLKCLHAKVHIQHARDQVPKKMTFAQSVKFYAALAMANAKDRVLPALLRIVGLATYISLIVFTYLITKDNIKDMAMLMFKVLTMLASFKALLEFVLPVLVVFVLAVFLVVAYKKKQAALKMKKVVDAKWPLLGQIIHGVSTGLACTIYLLKDKQQLGFSRDGAMLVGTAVGISLGFFIVAMAYGFHQCPDSWLSSNVFLVIYSIGLAIVVGLLAGHRMEDSSKIVILCLAASILIPVTGLAFRPSPMVERRQPAPSTIRPLIKTARILAAPFGTIAGVFAGGLIYDLLPEDMLGQHERVTICAIAGYLIGVIYTFVTDTVVQKKPGLYALVLGMVVTLTVGLVVHWALGVILGSVLGSLLGTYMEYREAKKINKMNLEPPRFTNAKVMSATYLSSGDAADSVEPAQPLPGSLPTLCKAPTPTSLTGSEEKLEDTAVAAPLALTAGQPSPLSTSAAGGTACYMEKSVKVKKHSLGGSRTPSGGLQSSWALELSRRQGPSVTATSPVGAGSGNGSARSRSVPGRPAAVSGRASPIASVPGSARAVGRSRSGGAAATPAAAEAPAGAITSVRVATVDNSLEAGGQQ